MKLERKVYETRSQKIGDFLIGIAIFIAINVVPVWLLYTIPSASPINPNIGLLLTVVYALELGLLIYLGQTRYWIALGILGSFAGVLLVGLFFTAYCFWWWTQY